MAKKVGLNRSSWSRIENGEVVPNAVMLDKIARVFETNPSDILFEADQARARLEKEGVVVHPDKVTAKSDAKKVGIGLALLGVAALGGLVARALQNKGEESSSHPPDRKNLPHYPDKPDGD